MRKNRDLQIDTNWLLVVDQEKNNSMEGDISNILNVIITSST